MKYERIEVRLDEQHLRKLSELKATYGSSVSDVVRRGVDALYDEQVAKRRREALEWLLAYDGGDDDVPEDMDELKRQLGRHPDYLPYDELP